MEIKFVFGKRNFSLSIGHDTPWFSQVPFVMFMEEFYVPESREIQHANIIFKIL
jgi:hypothetical protein